MNVLHRSIEFIMTPSGYNVTSYRDHDLEWWRERTIWFNRMINDDTTMPVSELMVDEFFTFPLADMRRGMMKELDRVYDFWATRPDLEEFLCK